MLNSFAVTPSDRKMVVMSDNQQLRFLVLLLLYVKLDVWETKKVMSGMVKCPVVVCFRKKMYSVIQRPDDTR